MTNLYKATHLQQEFDELFETHKAWLPDRSYEVKVYQDNHDDKAASVWIIHVSLRVPRHRPRRHPRTNFDLGC